MFPYPQSSSSAYCNKDCDLEKLIIHKNSKEPMIDYEKDVALLPELKTALTCNDGVFEVVFDGKNTNKVPNMLEFIKDLAFIIEQTHNNSNKSFCHNRLDILEQRFNMHLSFNRERESLQIQAISHRDFYNVRKVDTHVHHSACMPAKHLLEFIVNKIEVLLSFFVYIYT